MTTMKPDEQDFGERYLKAVTDWPGVVDPGEPEPDERSVDNGWKTIQNLEAEFTEKIGEEAVETIGTMFMEAVADYARAGLHRDQIRKALQEDTKLYSRGYFTMLSEEEATK